MPRVKIYASNAERQAAYNERMRQKERERIAAAAAERRRVQQLELDCRRALGLLIEAAPTSSINSRLQGLGYGPESAAECHAYIQRVIGRLKSGSGQLP